MNHDRLTNIDAKSGARAAFTTLDRLQLLPSEEQLVGTASLFLLLCAHYREDPQDVMTVTKALMHHQDHNHDFVAIRDYMKGELPQ